MYIGTPQFIEVQTDFDWGDQTTIGDASWWEGLANYLTGDLDTTILNSLVGKTKKVSFSSPVLGANAMLMRCISWGTDAPYDAETSCYLTFACEYVFPNTAVFSSSSAAWIGSNARAICQNFLNYCSAKNAIKATKRGTVESYPDSTSQNSTATYNYEMVFLPSEMEVGINKWSCLTATNATQFNSESIYGRSTLYKGYMTKSERVKTAANANGDQSDTEPKKWVLRSRSYAQENCLCEVDTDGAAVGGIRAHSSQFYFAPCFVIGPQLALEEKNVATPVQELYIGINKEQAGSETKISQSNRSVYFGTVSSDGLVEDFSDGDYFIYSDTIEATSQIATLSFTVKKDCDIKFDYSFRCYHGLKASFKVLKGSSPTYNTIYTDTRTAYDNGRLSTTLSFSAGEDCMVMFQTGTEYSSSGYWAALDYCIFSIISPAISIKNKAAVVKKLYIGDSFGKAQLYYERIFHWGGEAAIGDAEWWSELKNWINSSTAAERKTMIGKTKKVSLSSSVLKSNAALMVCIGADEDGTNTLTFQAAGLLNTQTAFGSVTTWNGSTVRSLCQDFYNACSAKDSIKTVKKGYTTQQAASSQNSTITYQNETVWLPSALEIGDTAIASLSQENSTITKAEHTYGYNHCYTYYEDSNNCIKRQMSANGDILTSTSPLYYWTRSRCKSASNGFCAVKDDGTIGVQGRTVKNSLAPAFVIG